MKKILITMFIIIISILSLSKTFACSCMIPQSPEVEIERVDYVFIWKVLSIKESNPLIDAIWIIRENKINFEISWIVKWDLEKNTKIFTSFSSASCGYNFEENKDYIVYASENEWKIEVSLCSRTSLLKNADEDLEAFKENIKEIPFTYSNDNKNFYQKNINIKDLYLFLSIITIIWIILFFVIKKINKK